MKEFSGSSKLTGNPEEIYSSEGPALERAQCYFLGSSETILLRTKALWLSSPKQIWVQ